MKKRQHPPQKQSRPGREKAMTPEPVTDAPKVVNKLEGKVALITGGDSGIGKAVALLFAKEGADIAIVYLKQEQEDADDTRNKIESLYGRKCLLIAGDVSKESFCNSAIKKVMSTFKKLDILVNNAATQFECDDLTKLETKNMRATFETNIFSMIWLTRAALPYLKKGSCIINSSSVTAYRGSSHLMDYAATKGAIVAFTRSLASNLVEKEIRVNGVAPGPIWTPLIPATFAKGKTVAKHGASVPMKRAGQPVEVAGCYLFLASQDSSYVTGQFLHPNGGEIVNA